MNEINKVIFIPTQKQKKEAVVMAMRLLETLDDFEEVEMRLLAVMYLNKAFKEGYNINVEHTDEQGVERL